MSTESRDAVRDTYSRKGDEYDAYRQQDPRGALLSNHDLALFGRLLPPCRAGMQALEAGAGTGRFTLAVLDRGYTLIATDINEAMLNELRKKIEQRNQSDRCQMQIEDIFKLSFADNTFDLVFSLHVIPRFLNLEDQRAALTELCRTIKPGGQLLFNYRNAKSVYHWIHKGHTASPDQIEKILRDAGMTVTHKRGKWFLNRSLINRVPMFISRCVSLVDRALETFWPNRAWDVFVLARKN
ncbi:MAG: methyltransferase domain-containing protein [Phycisphaeraceae bacterium]|nr:methyltransferase domain-containing protein [Phycisphaeraceae bacterium]